MKSCYTCKEYKKLTDFFRNNKNKGGLQGSCKVCHNSYNKKRRQDNREDTNAKNKIYRELNVEKFITIAKKSKLKKYGLTNEQYEQIFLIQKGKCCICTTHQSLLNKALCIDHDHKTGKIRGLLCDLCNRGLGYFKDNKVLLINAAGYLNED